MHKRCLINSPYSEYFKQERISIPAYDVHDKWPCSWISCPETGEPPFVTAYRKIFTAEYPFTVRAHVSADGRYELYIDGKRIG